MTSEDDWASAAAPYLHEVGADTTDAWTQQARQHGQTGTQKLLRVGEIPAPPGVGRALGVGPGEAVVLRSRLMLLDERPVEITDSYYRTDVARDTALAQPRKIRGGAVTLLASLGYTLGSRTERVEAREPTNEEQDMLATAPNEWVLEVSRILATPAGEPYEVTRMTMPARGRTLTYELKDG